MRPLAHRSASCDPSIDAVDRSDGAERPYDHPLRVAVIELTRQCNLRCPHCASHAGAARRRELSTPEWLDVLDQLVELACQKVTLLGGEVFLNHDWLHIARAVVDRGLQPSIITNGLLVDESTRRDLLSLPLEILGVSLDGADAEGYRVVRGVDGFAAVMNLLRRVRDEGTVPVNAITTFSRMNVHQLESFIETLEPEKIAWQVQFATTGSPRFDKRLFVSVEQYEQVCRRIGDVMLEALRSNWIATMDDMGYFPLDPRHRLLHLHWSGCQAGISVIGIRSNGDVLGCLSLGDAFVEGNVRARPLRELWRSGAVFRQFRRKSEAMLRGACAACPKSSRCLAGCAAMAVSSTGSIYENTHCLRRIETEQVLGLLGS